MGLNYETLLKAAFYVYKFAEGYVLRRPPTNDIAPGNIIPTNLIYIIDINNLGHSFLNYSGE